MTNQPLNPSALRGAVDLSSLAKPARPTTPSGGAGGQGGFVIDVDDRTFADAAQQSMQVPVLLALWSSSREDSKKHLDTLTKVVESYDGRILLARADINEALQIRQALQVQQVPMVLAIIQGQPLPLYVGDQPEAAVRDVVEQVLQAAQQAGVTGRVAGAPADTDEEAGDTAEQPLSADHQAAFDAIEQGDYAAAIAAYDRVLAADPDDEEARLGRGQIVLLQRTEGVDLNQARADAAAAPTDVVKQTLVADLDVLGGHVEDAFARLIEVVKATSGEERNAAREHLIGLFEVVGASDPRVKKARTALMSALY
ncbi:tetratricopeptide repeat protein [Calidifontibacter sp. DB0510]|uniref:Tetratricopeptide repeat protein n=1 Tax=Metallococcus carri TaxID=1656884 RepID=A0A967E9F4_9MICO|nr:tetratricopeptide repeat protein [Metallococcus carri]NHN56327.1 tetratricopeptide repeat protein [Metallococcus carri]NOP35951.1 tetratricopeptide repeat protein [Calidifontibacter sp. DB2511S]